MISQTTLVWTAAVIVLDTVGVETFYLTIVLGDDQLDQHLPLWSQKQPLKLLGILKFLKSLHKKVWLSPAGPSRFVLHVR